MNYKHGMVGTPTYRAWAAMHKRCNGKASSSAYYVNIRVCEKWATFTAFLADMGPRPDGCSLDRIDNDGNYEPDNCRWATKTEQMRNTRHNVMLTWNGCTKCVAEWAETLEVPKSRLFRRIYLGWPTEDVLHGKGGQA